MMTGMYVYRLRPEWHRPSSPQYRRKKEIGTLMLTRYADDWVAVWMAVEIVQNQSRNQSLLAMYQN